MLPYSNPDITVWQHFFRAEHVFKTMPGCIDKSFLCIFLLFSHIEMPLCAVLHDMERAGFLVDAQELSRLGCAVLAVSGNHDSPERLSFAASLLGTSRVYLAPVFEGAAPPVRLEDRFGPVDFYLLPFVKPVHVRRVYPEAEPETYTDAVAQVLSHWTLDPEARNVLLAHQLVTGSVRSESETISIGGMDNVDAEAFAGFDYVALGHLHRAQDVGPGLRYAGSPLAYSFSEGGQEKSVTLVELGEKGKVTVTARPLTPLHPLTLPRG